jgi:hypothetical protein
VGKSERAKGAQLGNYVGGEMNEERKLYEEWLHKVKETIIDEWDAWQARAALAQPEPAVEPTAEDIAQDWDLLKETQAALRDAWAILNKLKAVQDAARHLVESDPDSAADTEGDAFTAWCALVAAIDDADTLLCEFGESHE